MGTIKKGILGGFSGTVGTVVGANWRGMDVIRSRPKSSGKKPTPQQLMQRKKFALAIKFQNALRSMQSRLYGEDAGVQSRVNLAAGYLMREVITFVNDEAVLQMNKVIITKGTMTGFQNLTATASGTANLSFVWEDNSSQILAKATDIFSAVVYEAGSAEFAIKEGPEARTAGAATINLPEMWVGKTVDVYAFFQNEEQIMACNSFYLGKVVVQ